MQVQEGAVVHAVVVQANAVIVTEVRVDYECDGKWHCHELHKMMIRNGEAYRPGLDLYANDLFSSESQAIAEAKRRRPTGNKGGRQ